jgi:hypothetical protein
MALLCNAFENVYGERYKSEDPENGTSPSEKDISKLFNQPFSRMTVYLLTRRSPRALSRQNIQVSSMLSAVFPIK